MVNSNSNNGTSRRRLLLSTGAACSSIATIPLLGTAQENDANPSVSGTYQRALSLREENNWSVGQFRSHLQENGFEFGYQDVSKPVPGFASSEPDDAEDQIGTQQIPKSMIDLSLTITYNDRYTYTTHVDLNWEITVPRGAFVDGNLPPNDVVQIEWQGDEVDPDGDPYGSEFVSEHTSSPSVKTSGVSMSYDDKDAYLDNPNGDDARYERSWSDYMGAHVNLGDGDRSSRDFYMRYYHVYSNTDYQISWTYGAPSISFSNNSEKWVADGMAYESEMESGKDWDCETDSC